MKIQRQVVLSYVIAVLSIAALIVFGVLYLKRASNQVQFIDDVEHHYKVLSTIDFCEKALIEAEASQRGFLLTNDSVHFSRFNRNLPLIDSSLQKIGELTSRNASQRAFYAQLIKFVAIRTTLLRNSLLSPNRDTTVSPTNLLDGVLAMDNCRYYMAKMRAVEEKLVKQGVVKKDTNQQLNQVFFKATFVMSCLICMIAIAIFIRELRTRLKAQRNLRTKVNELSNSKHELEQITFAASHDLQEPMRKIRILSNLAATKLNGKIPTEDLEVINRVNTITEQMHGLLTDLVLYTNLLNPNEKYGPVNFYEVLKQAYYKTFVEEEDVQLSISSRLPTLNGSYQQVSTMLIIILDNACKFKKPGQQLTLNVHYEVKRIRESKFFWKTSRAKKYHVISITDNGIGFEDQYNEKIFGLFQRLHTHMEYPGKGLGLSIARRVMTNHDGYISAVGRKDEGATIMLYFPEEKTE